MQFFAPPAHACSANRSTAANPDKNKWQKYGGQKNKNQIPSDNDSHPLLFSSFFCPPYFCHWAPPVTQQKVTKDNEHG
jgi:hypothetical protein